MIDTHAHLHLPDFDADRDQVMARDFALGITGVVEVCISPRAWPSVRRLAHGDPRIVATAGIHPHEAARFTPADLERLSAAYDDPRVVAVGETGLDTYRDYAPLADQQRLFGAHVAMARRVGLPLVIHCREAFAEVFAILDREGGGQVTGVFHCFSGGPQEAREVQARGFMIGLAGSVTYAPQKWRPVVGEIAPGRLLLETDCPYLRPAPDRRGRNEPAFVFQTAQVVADLLDQDCNELIATADANARALFGAHWAPPSDRHGAGDAHP